MIFHFTAEDIERANRIMQDPFESDEVRFHIYPKLVASDDGLFEHQGDCVPCDGCRLDPFTGETMWFHGHIVVEGTNGGLLCSPLTEQSVRGLVRDLLYPEPSGVTIKIVAEADDCAGVAIDITAGAKSHELQLRITPTARDLLSQGADNLELLVQRGLLFDDSDS